MEMSRKNVFTLKWFLLGYMILGSTLSHTVPLPELAKSILSLPAWLILPYFYGELLKPALYKLKTDFYLQKSSAVLSLFLGIYFTVVTVFLLDLLGLQIISQNLQYIILLLTCASMTCDSLRHHKFGPTRFPSLLKMDILVIVFCLLVSIIPALVNRSVFPFPYGTVETISIPFEQYQPALRFKEHGYLQLPRIYDSVSLGFCSQLFNIDPLSFIWSASFLMMAIFSVGLFLLGWALSRSKLIGLLAALVGSFLNMNVFRDIPTLFRANVFMYVLLAPALYLLFANSSRKDYKARDVILTLLCLGLVSLFFTYLLNSQIWKLFVPSSLQNPAEWSSHVWIPSVIVMTAPTLLILVYVSKFLGKDSFMSDNAPILVLLIFFFLALNDSEYIAFIVTVLLFVGISALLKNRRFRWLSYIFSAGVLFFILFQNYAIALPVSNPISSILFPAFAQAESTAFSFSTRFEWLLQINMTSLLTLFLVLGVIIVALLSFKRENLLIISAFSLVLFLYFFPETYSYRFYKEVTIITALVIAIGIASLLRVLSHLRWSQYSRIVLSTLIIALLIPTLVVPIYQRSYQSLLGQSMVSDYEYAASNWIMKNTPENTIILSDYATMELLAPLSNRMLPVPRMYLVQGLSQQYLQYVWYIKSKLSPIILTQNLWNGSDAFWVPYKWGEGNADVLTETVQEPPNNGSQKIDVFHGSYGWVGVMHSFGSGEDWNNVSSLSIYWLGKNTGTDWELILAAPNDTNWFAFDLLDDFTGWQDVTFQLSDSSIVGSPNLTNISYLAVRTENPSYDTWLLGNVSLGYLASMNLTASDVPILKQTIDSADKRYAQFTNISLENETVLIILTERTVQWIEQNGISEIWYPVQLPVDSRYVQLFNDCSHLSLKYSLDGEIYVFEVK